MAYVKDETVFRHKVWGIGVFRGYGSDGILLIEFPDQGIKKLLNNSIDEGILKEVTHVAQVGVQEQATRVDQRAISTPSLICGGNSVRQYDSACTTIGEKNVLAAFECEDVVIFNESYVVVGAETRAYTVNATYDLTIIGNLSVEQITVNGSLTVIGHIAATKINCSNNLLCQGNINAKNIFVGADLIADSVKCSEFVCEGNAVIRTTVDIDKSSYTEKTMVACEGIIGGGKFVATNAIANEYFEFDGDVQGHIVELETDTTLSEIIAPVTPVDILSLSIDEFFTKVNDRVYVEYTHLGELDEDALVELTRIFSSCALSKSDNMSMLFEQLIQISYKDEIDDLSDYLLVVYAKKFLPPQLYHYESIEHIDSVLLPKAEACLDEMSFAPSSVEKIAQSLHMIMCLQGNLPLSMETLCDKVFSSFGLRFSTVKGIIAKTASQETHSPSTTSDISEIAVETPPTTLNAKNVSDNKERKSNNVVLATCENLDEFYAKPLSSVGKTFGMTNDEIQRLGSVKIRTVGDFISVDAVFVQDLYKKKPFLANHLISVLKKMRASSKYIT